MYLLMAWWVGELPYPIAQYRTLEDAKRACEYENAFHAGDNVGYFVKYPGE